MISINTLRELTTPTITAETAGKVLGIDAQTLRITARTKPKALGFPVICSGRRVVIPRIPFIRFIEEGGD